MIYERLIKEPTVVLASALKSLVSGMRARTAEARAVEDMRTAVAFHESGDASGALTALQRILSRTPAYADAHYLAGLWLAQSGESTRARPHLEQAAGLMPDNPDAQLALGNIFKATGEPHRAAESYSKAIALAPHAAAGHYNLGLLLKLQGAAERALQCFEQACAREPYVADAWRQRVLCLVQLARYGDAESVARDALRGHEGDGILWSALGLAHQKQYQPAEALQCYERALSLCGPDHEVYNNIGIAFQDAGRLQDAIAAYDKSIALNPDFPLSRFHRALACLLMHDYEHAWQDYELRLLSEDRPPAPGRFPRWNGESLAGRSILVYGEQGLGDEIMFASCLPQVLEQARQCTVLCSPKLEPIFRRSFPAARVERMQPERPDLVAIDEKLDFEMPAGSLPLHFRRARGAFPRHAGYLRADPARVAYWRQRLAMLGPGPKVGISWCGGTAKTRSAARSLALRDWKPILSQDARFISLQYGPARGDVRACDFVGRERVVEWPEALDDYDETAALVSALDVTISVCTAVIHLAGALGRPVWIMAPMSPEWRYGISGAEMPWYPTARVFRQNAAGEWGDVLEQVASQLRALCAHASRATAAALSGTT
jgi:tetratricopeptide (TPR) repeat protein